MTSHTRLCIEYLITTDNIQVLLWHSYLILKYSLIDKFSLQFNDNSAVAYLLLSHPVHSPDSDEYTLAFDKLKVYPKMIHANSVLYDVLLYFII